MNRVLTAMKPHLITVLGVGLAWPLFAAEKPQAEAKAEAGYIRFREHDKGAAMEVAVIQMKNTKTGVQVDLVGAVHIGDKAYYEEVLAEVPPRAGESRPEGCWHGARIAR